MSDNNKGYVLLSAQEAAMIKVLRESDFGQWTVYKNNGEPTRIIKGGSEMLDAKVGEELFEH